MNRIGHLWTLLFLPFLACGQGTSGSLLEGAPLATTAPATEPARAEPPLPHEIADAGEDAGPDSSSDFDAAVDLDAALPDASIPPTSPFDGAPPYVATLGPTARKPGHNFVDNNPAGRPCLQCHNGSGVAARFAVAGTVYDGTIPAANVEVRAIGADGKPYYVYSDADGNFFFSYSTAPVAFKAMVGVRNQASTRVMTRLPQSGNCNMCHSAVGSAGPLLVSP